MAEQEPLARSPRHVLGLALALPLLLIGLSCVFLPVLDMLPLPGSSRQGFFEWWLPGIPLSWMGLRLLRFGIRGSTRGRSIGSEPKSPPS